MAEEIKNAIDRVDPKHTYNVTEMRRAEVLPWLTTSNPVVYVNAIMDDKISDNLLKAKITGKGRGRDYKIKGKNIINYLNYKSQDEHSKRNEGGSGSA